MITPLYVFCFTPSCDAVRFIRFSVLRRRVRPVMWCKPRSKIWWCQVVSGVYGGKWWKENMRMSRQTFESLCGELRPYLQREDTNFRSAVSVETRVAATIWRLATNTEYCTIAQLFGLEQSTVGEIVIDTVK